LLDLVLSLEQLNVYHDLTANQRNTIIAFSNNVPRGTVILEIIGRLSGDLSLDHIISAYIDKHVISFASRINHVLFILQRNTYCRFRYLVQIIPFVLPEKALEVRFFCARFRLSVSFSLSYLVVYL